MDHWFNENLLTFGWWFLLISMVAFGVAWWFLLDKSRITEILLYGFMIAIVVKTLDTLGVAFLFWGYPNKLFPVIPSIIEIDIGHLPFVYMLIYQYFRSWKCFFAAMTITASIFSFVFEPIAVWLGIYQLYKWESIYSFPIYIVIGVFLKWLMMKVKQLEEKHI